MCEPEFVRRGFVALGVVGVELWAGMRCERIISENGDIEKLGRIKDD